MGFEPKSAPTSDVSPAQWFRRVYARDAALTTRPSYSDAEAAKFYITANLAYNGQVGTSDICPSYPKLLKSIRSHPDLTFRPLYAIIRYIRVRYMRGLLYFY